MRRSRKAAAAAPNTHGRDNIPDVSRSAMAKHNPRAAAGDKRAADTSDSANTNTAPPKKLKFIPNDAVGEPLEKDKKNLADYNMSDAAVGKSTAASPDSPDISTAQPMDGDLDPKTAIGIPTEEVRDWKKEAKQMAAQKEKEAEQMAAQKEKEAKQMAAQKLMDDAHAARSRGGSSRRQMLEARVAQLSNELDAGHAQFARDLECHATHTTGLTGLVAAARMQYDKEFADKTGRTGPNLHDWDGSAPLKACGGSLDDDPLDVDMADAGEVDYNTILSRASAPGGLPTSSASPKFPDSSLDVEGGANAVWFKDTYGQVTHEDRVPMYDRPAYKFPIGAPADFWKKFKVDDESEYGPRENLKAAPTSRSVWFATRWNRGGRGCGHGGGRGRSRRGR
ncbi:hypothetical protein CKM354_000875600 [Cercospora kikuchii]|uniref:Uncharacterized protein n=1 Tax=Cercospora kikuchii TaxID=84275 RepID=A0A9P3CLV6_9PEZI|nr:uncharacterized protein CKM354_000875600 [Cercospora kikuchii]GIZ45597.1 hypothetical protein CKM354_000875600 [Cercospora kikuchii]